MDIQNNNHENQTSPMQPLTLSNAQPPQGGNTQPPAKHSSNLPLPLIILFLIIAFFIGLIISAWYFQTKLAQITTTDKKDDQIIKNESKPLIIGTDATFQPMEYANKQGELVGYDIDLSNDIADELGTKVEIKNMQWDDLFNALEKKQIDTIISSVTITDERKQKYNFSDPYLNAGQVIITRQDTNNISSTENLKGKKIAVQKGTTSEQEAYKLTSKNLVIQYDDFTQITKALVDRKVDAIFSDLPGAKGIVITNPELKISSEPFTNDYYGVVLRKEDTELRKRINDAISGLGTKGALTDLKQKWLD